MSFVSPLELKKLMTEPTGIKKTQSYKVNNQNWVEGKKMDQKIDDLFNKIKRVTSDWNAYVVNNPLGQTQHSTKRTPLVVLESTNETKYNPERSTIKSASKTPMKKYATQRMQRQISQGPTYSVKKQILYKAPSLQLPLGYPIVNQKRSV